MKKIITFIILTSLVLCLIPAQVLAFNENEITSSAAILMEAETGKVLFEKNSSHKILSVERK